jgi:HSP20 family protein
MATEKKDTKKEADAQRAEPARGTEVAPYRQGGMTRYGWEPIDRLAEQFFRGWPTPWAGPGRHWDLDVQERDNDMVVRAEAPGFEPGDFDIQVRGDQLVLRANHRAEHEEKDRGYYEWSRQEFYRTVPLPAATDPNKVEARYRNGVLTVTLPKTEDGRGRRIAVQG